jgi:hypothetical protein
MDVISQKAKDFCISNIVDPITLNSVIEKTASEVYSFYEPADKIKFLQVVRDMHSNDLKEHKLFCSVCLQNPDQCDYKATYYYINSLENEIKKFSSVVESFEESELNAIQKKLDKIIKDIGDIKDGQEITYDDFLKEFSELKSCTDLGKKKWRQILLGKMFEMTVSGIISESVSKSILNEFRQLFDDVVSDKLIN